MKFQTYIGPPFEPDPEWQNVKVEYPDLSPEELDFMPGDYAGDVYSSPTLGVYPEGVK